MDCDDPATRQADVRASALKQAMADLPYVSDHIQGIGGTIKARAEDFQVEEVLAYAPCGEGEHLYVTIKRKGWNTADLGRALARCLELKPGDVGWGGRKDKQAQCTQTFSLHIPATAAIADLKESLARFLG